MEDIERVSPAQIASLRAKFSMAVSSQNPDLYVEDIERVKVDDLWIRRFIAAQDDDVDKATKMLFETCQWRKEFGVNELDHRKLSNVMVEKGTLFMRNQDNWGKVLLIFKAKTHTKGVHDMEDIKKFVVYWFERAERHTKSDQITLVFDMKDCGLSNMDMDFVRYLITLTKQYYPYFVNYLLIYEMAWTLKAAWNIIKGWLDKKAVERIKFVDKKNIGEFISTENQLVDWGGTDTYTYSFEPEVRTRKSSLKNQPKSFSSFNNNLSSDDSSPDAKPRKVQFTDRDGSTDLHRIEVETQSPERVSSPPRMEPEPPVPRRRETPPPAEASPREERRLIETDSIVLFEHDGDEYAATVHITNVANAQVIFKIKTTAPNSYRVNPTIGLMGPGAEAAVSISANGRVNTREHRFQIQAAIFPPDLDTGEDDDDGRNIDFNRLNTFWKSTIERRGSVTSTRLTCTVNEPRSFETRSPTQGAFSEETMRKGLLDLQKDISESIQQALRENNNRIITILYIIIGILVFFGLLNFFMMPSGCGAPLPQPSFIPPPSASAETQTPISSRDYSMSGCVGS